jgi:hypothetical protein
MFHLSSSYSASVLGPALVIALIVIGVVVRVAMIAQPGTPFQSYFRLFKRNHPYKNPN